ncbi:hypothetical protein [Aestuariimicrobium sp. Y1814]|uniref:ATP-binding protein n=1 Tax=Aestuariimicrobium sp. Y1814 TaxID=3418742 RepID=UPI003DA7A021
MPTSTNPTSWLGEALGRAMAQTDGLSAAYLPSSVPPDAALAMVSAANDARRAAGKLSGREPDFAIACSSTGIKGTLSPQEAIRYRTGDRLVVVVGQHPDLSSFVQAFVEQLGPDYPHSTTDATSMGSVATAALELLFAAQHTNVVSVASPAKELADCMTVLADAYRASGSGTEVWNSYWFRHIDEGLHGIHRFMESQHVTTLDALKGVIQAAMSLPVGLPKGARAGTQLHEAIATNWADAEQIRTSAGQLQQRRTHPHPDLEWLEQGPWDELSSQSAEDGYDHPILAMHTTGITKDPERHIDALSTLTWEELTDPDGVKDRPLTFHGGDAGKSLHELGELTAPALVPMYLRAEGAVFESPRLIANVPLVDGYDREPGWERLLADVDLKFSSRGIQWVPAGTPSARGGTLRVPGRIQMAKCDRLRLTKATVDVPARSKAALLIGRPTAPLIVIPGTAPALVSLALSTKTRLGKAQLHLPEGEGLGVTSVPLEGANDVVVVAVSPDSSPRIDGQPMEEWALPGLFCARFALSDEHEVLIGDEEFRCHGVTDKTEYQTPLEAAITQSLVTGKQPSWRDSGVRGWYEQQLSDNIESVEWLKCHGHVITSSQDGDNQRLRPFRGRTGLLPEALHSDWKDSSVFQVPDELGDSQEAKTFRAAFEALDLPARMRRTDEGETFEWPSRVSWRDLAGSAALDAYLESYVALVELAESLHDQNACFWAAHPFSLSIWESETKCRAVMLSPLHPLRLAWLANVESTLWNASQQSARAMAGLVEGWNIPVMGTGPDSEPLLAVPIDAGERGLFVGWSQLVEVSPNSPQSPTPPARSAGLDTPGAASSGLNGATARNALRSYRRLNPHVTTLTVDLAAAANSPRMQELDEAVLDVLSSFRDERTLPGGVRVADSLNRRGPIPAESIERSLAGDRAVPLTWHRYRGQAPHSNIRLLQDAGVHVALTSDARTGAGILGQVPLRRLEAPSGGAKGRDYYSLPALSSSGTLMHKAIRAYESLSPGSALRARLHGSALVSGDADWSVTGESMLSPAALASLVEKASGGKQMLWEWQPPVMRAMQAEALLQRRPHISVVRIPGAFRTGLAKQVEACHPAGGAGVVDQVLETLGTRGVGLSSLVAIGGAHASGALGFYLAFRLMEHVTVPGTDVLVLPMDACDAFLRALAADNNENETKQRADLLALVTSGSSVTLVPIEIKFYGAAGEFSEGPLPEPTSLTEATQQALASAQLLKACIAQQETLRDAAGSSNEAEPRDELALWNAGLASLLEAAYRLKPQQGGDSSAAASLLQAAADDGLELKTAPPLISYFKLGASDPTPKSGVYTASEQPYGALVTETRATFEQVEDPDSEVVTAWRSLFSTSLAAAAGGEGDPTPSATQQVPEPDPVPSPATDPTRVDEDAEPAVEPEHAREQPYRPRRALVENDEPDRHATPQPEDEGAPQDGGEVALGEDGRDLRPPAGEEPTPQRETLTPPGIKFTVGTRLGVTPPSPITLWPSNTALTQLNIGVVGDLGTGKTQLLKSLLYNLHSQGQQMQPTPVSMLVLDYKSDYSDDEFMSTMGGRVLKPSGIPLNIFARGASDNFRRAQSFIDVLDKIYSGVGPVQRMRLSESIMEAYDNADPDDPTLAEVFEIYRERTDGKDDSVTSILYNFVRGGVFSSDRDELIPFRELIDGKVVTLSLNSLGADQNTKNALVALFLNMYYEYMLESMKWPFEGSDPQLRRINSYLVVDEASNLMRYDFPALGDLLVQGREFGIGVILSSQYLSHFKTSGNDYGQPLLTWFIHRVPRVAGKDLTQLGISGDQARAAQQIPQLGQFQCYYRSLGVDGTFIRTVPYFELVKRHQN